MASLSFQRCLYVLAEKSGLIYIFYSMRAVLNRYRYGLYGRIFWTIIIIVSCWNVITIFLLMWKRFVSDSVSIGIETTFLQWNNTFPAISFCLSKGRSNVEVAQFIKTKDLVYTASFSNYAKNINSYLFTNPSNINVKDEYCEGTNATCGVDIMYFRSELLPKSCELFMSDLKFLSRSLADCKDIFKFHELEMGYCFLANNLIDYDTFESLPLKFNINDVKRNLKLFLKHGSFWKYEMYIHSPVDLPYFNLISYESFSEPSLYVYNAAEILNDDDVFNENIHQRKCKFPNEIMYESQYHYSFSTCMTDLRIHLEFKMCNCTLFTGPKKYSKHYCDIKGLICLSNADIIHKAKKFISTKNVCYPSCVEQQIAYVGLSEVRNVSKSGYFYIEIEIIDIPTLRYKRVVTETNLDLVVSVGGVIGLVLGASLLNIAEIIYICLRRNIL